MAQKFVLSKDIAAFWSGVSQAVAETRAGLLAKLPVGSEVEVIGPGFSERSVKVKSQGITYFVFLQDLEHGVDHPAALFG